MPTQIESPDSGGRHGALLLRICAAPDGDHSEALRALTDAEWQALAELAETKRVAPILRRCIERSDAATHVPAAVRTAIDKACQWHSVYGLKQTVALGRLWQTLTAEGFRPLLLKGVALAHRDYPDPALRPMRDVDLLLSRDEAERAQAFLIAHDRYRLAPWAGSYGVEYNHQLPEIQDIAFELTIEVHHRINARGWAQEPLLVDLLQIEAESLRILGHDMKVPSPRTNFLHLVEHATLHHAFENGPLTLVDLHFVATRHDLDWEWIESEAARLGLSNSLRLVARVARDHGATWVPDRLCRWDAPSPDYLAAACAALLQDREVAEQNKLLRRLGTSPSGQWGWTGALRKAMRPDPYQLAQIAGSRPDEMRRWLAYPAWLFRRGRRYRAAVESEIGLAAALREAAMMEWMASE